MSNASNETVADLHLVDPHNAWMDHPVKLIIMFTHYIICFTVGQFLNWLCLLNINKTNLNQSARYLMITQCIMNIWYLTVNFPYKAAVLYLQKTFLPWPLKEFCGWLHLVIVFGSMFLQDVMAVTRVLYIVFPVRANAWFNTKLRCLILPLTAVTFGLLYAFPSLHQCCYRIYRFASYSMDYVGPRRGVQLWFSVIGFVLLVIILTACYTWVILAVRKNNKIQAQKRKHRTKQCPVKQSENKEIRLAALFAVTGGVWSVYLTMFYVIHWTRSFQPSSALLLANEMLEQLLFFVDPIVYIAMSSELRRTLLKVFGIRQFCEPQGILK